MSCPPLPVSPQSEKNFKEKQRCANIRERVDELRKLTNDNDTTRVCFAAVLHRVANMLNGKDANAPIAPILPPPSPGPIRSQKEVRRDRQKTRHDAETAGFKALQKYVIENGLSPFATLSRCDLLDIIIAEVRKFKSAVRAPAYPALSPIAIVAPQFLLPTVFAPTAPAPVVVPEPVFPMSALRSLLAFYNILNIPFPTQ